MAEAAAASALVGAAPAAPRQPCRRRPPAPRRVADLRCRAAAGEGVPTPLDVLRNDVSYLEDLHGELVAAHRSAHDEVVAVLNPIAGEQMQRELEEQIAGMQAELAAAHMQIHRSEGRLRDTVANLTELENSVRRSFGPSSWTNGPAVAPAKAMAAPAAAAAATAAPEAAVQQRPRPQPAAPAPPAQRTAEPRSGGRAGLASRGKPGLAIPEQLKDYWFPVEFSASLVADRMVPFELFGETWVLFRDEHGVAACVKDECAHRACPLSLGSVVDGRLQCPYHGWEYDRAGACTKMPSTAFCKGIKVEALPVSEADGLVWVWPGRPEVHAEAGPPPPLARPPPGFELHAELVLDVPVEHGLLLENLLDLAHAPFTHTTTFAKGWPVPDVVRFNAARLLGGSWEPYPIDMEFGPPCLVLSTIGLTSPGKIERGARADSCKNHLHQLHVCLPSSEGRTRLLYRMSLDFLGWTRNLPGIGAFWKSIAEQVLGEDLVLVKGQQDRMSRGADVWANPVSYDKLGVRYRRWRNSVASGDPAARQQAEASLRQMSAGDIFAPTAGQEEAH